LTRRASRCLIHLSNKQRRTPDDSYEPAEKGLKEGKSYVGTFVKMADASSVEIISMCGFDFFVIDCEHTHLNKETMVSLLRAAIFRHHPDCAGKGEQPGADSAALDSGGLGVMVPETSSAQEVRSVVETHITSPSASAASRLPTAPRAKPS
jgi:2-keto-3-deoxy-L-rhamnonate aldolase RhmA